MNVAVMSDHLCAFGCEGDVALEGLILGGCQDFGEVHRADARVEAGEAAADVHEAGVVAHDEDLGARGHDVGDLVREHRGGGLGVLHGEGAAESAADLGVGQVDEGQAFNVAQEAVGAVTDLGDTQRVARRVVGDGVGEVGAHVFQAENVGDELGQVVGVLGDELGLLGQLVVAHVLGDDLLLVARCTGAGAGGDDDGVPLAVEHGLEGLDVVAGDLGCVFEVAGVGVHLSAAHLVFREDDFVAEALEQRDCRLGGLGEHDVCQASGEKSDTHWGSFLVGAVAHQYGWVRGPGRPIVWGLRWVPFGSGVISRKSQDIGIVKSWLWEGCLGPLGPDLEQGDLAFIVSLSSRALTGKPGPRSWMFHGRGPGWVLGGVARPFGMRRGNASEAMGRGAVSRWCPRR